MKHFPFWMIICISALPGVVCCADLPEGKITVRVIGEEGAPLEGAEAAVTYEIPRADGSGETQFVNKTGFTGKDGLFVVEGKMLPYVAYGAKKTGYYLSTNLQFDLKLTMTKGSPEPVFGARYEPWNPVRDIVLKRIMHPVSMYARHMRCTIPKVGEDIGFDLMAADWVAPFGKGSHKDFVLHLTKELKSRTDYRSKLELRFSADGDGIQSVYADGQHGSALRLAHSAPATGYEPTWSRRMNSDLPAPARKDQNYYFRVRADRRDGKIVSALYGKVYGEILFDVINSATADLIFTYYLNPDGTQNMEFDPQKNLFDLDAREEVNEP